MNSDVFLKIMKIYERIDSLLKEFLTVLAGDEQDFTYEITCCSQKNKFSTTYRSKSKFDIIEKIAKNAHNRNIYISPFSTQYPEGSSDFVYGRKISSSNSIVIDIDSKDGEKVDYKKVLKLLKENGIQKPTYLISSGVGCHLWYILSNHVGCGRIRNIYEKIREKIISIEWPKTWKIDDLSVKQQFRVPFTINHKYDKIVTIVDRGEQLKIIKSNFIKPKSFTKKELKRYRKIKSLGKRKKKKKIENEQTDIKNLKAKYLEGALNLPITIKQKVQVDKTKLKKIIQLLKYGKSFLSCRVAGEALGVSYRVAAMFLRKCVDYGYLIKINNPKNSAYTYKINVEYEMQEKKTKGRCPISGPGQSNKALCRLAYQAFKYGLDKVYVIKDWIRRFYDITSKEHTPEELETTYYNVYEKFESGRYQLYGVT